MKKLLFALVCSSLFFNTAAFAGPGHAHSHGPISEEKAIQKAEKRLVKLVNKGKIDKSWKDVKANKAEKKTFKGSEEWIVTFNNPELADKSKRKLYMFFKVDGHYLATNYTGK